MFFFKLVIYNLCVGLCIDYDVCVIIISYIIRVSCARW